eukprot:s1008_g4.t1
MQPRVCLHTFCSCPSCGAWILAWHLQNRQLLPRSAVGSSRLLLSLGVEGLVWRAAIPEKPSARPSWSAADGPEVGLGFMGFRAHGLGCRVYYG